MTEKKERRYALEQELAPHIEPRWSEDFILELRLRGVAGDHIGAALAEADSHCAESGESAEEAFGRRRSMRAVSDRRFRTTAQSCAGVCFRPCRSWSGCSW